jgi:hypothetical protein
MHEVEAPRKPGGIFNVFLHGLTVCNANTLHGIHHPIKGYQQCPPDHATSVLDIHIPNMGFQHCYRYGEFLGEVSIQPAASPYWITNIIGGCKRFDPNKSLVVNAPLCRNPDIYATIRLPLPQEICYMMQVDLDPVLEDPGQLFAPGQKTMAMVPVLVYTFEDFRRILFGGSPLNVSPVEHGDELYVNLHIFAEEDRQRPDFHTIVGFDKALSLFDIPDPPRLASLSGIAPPPLPFSPLPPGTTLIEYADLSERTRDSGYLGRVLREELLYGRPFAFTRATAQCKDPASCGNIAS